MTSRSRGGEGGCPKHDVVREVAWIYSYDQPKMRDKGGRGVQKPENLRDVIYGWSPSNFLQKCHNSGSFCHWALPLMFEINRFAIEFGP